MSESIRRTRGRNKPPPDPITNTLLLELWLLGKYGPRLTLDNLAEVLQISYNTVKQAISANRFPVPTHIELGGRFADYRDVARYLNSCRVPAAELR